MEEYLDIVDEKGNPIGGTVERKEAHLKGIMHRTAHVWVVRKRGEEIQVLLQKRSENKDSFPGCLDISSAGHIPSGFDFKESAKRELKEELGIEIAEDELIFCGDKLVISDDEFHGLPFHDRQLSRAFFILKDVDKYTLKLQEEEVESVQWMELYELMDSVKYNRIKHAIFYDELEMLERALKKEKVVI